MDEQTRQRYTSANREAWNEAAPIHAEHNQAALLQAVTAPDYCNLSPELREQLDEIGVRGKSVAQLCCNNGIDLLSVRRLGAGRCVGFDAAERFIEQASELAAATGEADIEHVRTDIYAIDPSHHGQFDVVLVTVGVLLWMPDLPSFFAAARELLKPGGHLLLEDMHPVLLMYEPDADGGPSRPVHSYFHDQPWREDSGLDYFSGASYDSKPNFSFQHTLSAVLMAAIGAGLTLRHISEIGRNIGNFCEDLEQAKARPPMGMVLLWQLD